MGKGLKGTPMKSNNLNIDKIESIIGYTFKNKKLVQLALSHSSYANEKKGGHLDSYERLEFLGDSIVSIIVSEYLYINYPTLPEGELTRIRAIVVCESTFCGCVKKLEIGSHLLLGKGEERTGGRERVSILADIFEAIIGAIYLDGCFEDAKSFTLSHLKSIIESAVSGTVFMDYKTQLQEILQKTNTAQISYIIEKETGPDHNKEFLIQVINNNKILGRGNGKSKKEAEQNAAKEALDKLK